MVHINAVGNYKRKFSFPYQPYLILSICKNYLIVIHNPGGGGCELIVPRRKLIAIKKGKLKNKRSHGQKESQSKKKQVRTN